MKKLKALNIYQLNNIPNANTYVQIAKQFFTKSISKQI